MVLTLRSHWGKGDLLVPNFMLPSKYHLVEAPPTKTAESPRSYYFRRAARLVSYILYGLLALLLSVATFRGVSSTSKWHRGTEDLAAPEKEFDWQKIKPSPELHWVDCYQGRQCARLEVPLDYEDPTGDKAAIAILRVKAKVSPQSHRYRGPVLFNPGGPGGSGTQFINGLGDHYHTVLGDEYDIIGFDPRGVGQTTPPVSIFADQWERAYWESKSPPLFNSTSDALPRAYARAQLVGELAGAHSKRAAQHVSTAVVARDMLTITKAHGRDRLLYWGFSYGTVLGSTYAAMFPDNIERLIIDGVVDLDDYYAGGWSRNLYDTDKILQYFYDKCFESGPGNCPLHANSSALVQQRVEAVFELIKANPLPVFNGTDYAVIDYTALKSGLFQALYKPFTGLPMMANILAGLEKGDGRPALTALSLLKQSPTCKSPSGLVPVSRAEATLAVACGEALGAENDISDLTRYFEELSKISVFADVWTNIRVGCAGWTVRAKTRFAGPFASNTSFPLLVIGNTADAVTPLRGAKKAAGYFNGSALLTVNTPGHCSEAGTSLCATRHIRRYFRDGELPEEGTVCEIEDVLFGAKPKASQDLNMEDQKLLEAARQLSQKFHAARNSPLL